MAETIALEKVVKVFQDGDQGEILAVDGIDLDIDAGEFVVLVGPSGCGKSTTLRCIAGLEKPTDGKIYIGDEDVTHHDARDRDIALVFQNYALYPHMTAEGNMEFGLKMSTDMSKEERKERVHEVAEMMGIEEHLDSKPSELSGGQQQRVALGRAIVRDPQVFLMDEPLSNLDAKLRTHMRTEIQELQNQFGITTVYVTHNQTEAMTMGDRIAIMNQGEILQCSDPIECYNRPTNRFVATFIGDPAMNIVPVVYDQADGTVSNEFMDYHLNEQLARDLGPEPPVDLDFGIRPEHIEIESDPARGDIEVEVGVIEPHGNVTYVYANVGGNNLTIEAESTTGIEEGDTIGLRLPEHRVYLFDRQSGDRLAGEGELAPPVSQGDTSSAEAG